MNKPEQIEALLFDFDGTLVDTEPEYFRVDHETFARFGITGISDEDMHSVVGTDGTESIPALAAKYGLPGLTYEEYLTKRTSVKDIYRNRPLAVMAGAREMLFDLKTRGYKLALVSTTDAYNVVYATNRLGFTSLFDAIVTGDMLDNHKPLPDPYLLGCEFLHVDPAHAIAVEDSRTGIASAQAAGLFTIGFAGSIIKQDWLEG
jgi:HAD superfamily hydrolase (TIGR01509 family)